MKPSDVLLQLGVKATGSSDGRLSRVIEQKAAFHAVTFESDEGVRVVPGDRLQVSAVEEVPASASRLHFHCSSLMTAGVSALAGSEAPHAEEADYLLEIQIDESRGMPVCRPTSARSKAGKWFVSVGGFRGLADEGKVRFCGAGVTAFDLDVSGKSEADVHSEVWAASPARYNDRGGLFRARVLASGHVQLLQLYPMSAVRERAEARAVAHLESSMGGNFADDFRGGDIILSLPVLSCPVYAFEETLVPPNRSSGDASSQ